jgi:hypothetical protein
MSINAFLPCFKCGKELPNVYEDSDNQPYGGTEFRTQGHYGSTFWDSFDGEDLILNVCDDCLSEHSARLGQQKVFLPIKVGYLGGFGRQMVDRPIVGYTGHLDDSVLRLDVSDLGADLPNVEWSPHIDELKAGLEEC